MGFGGLLSYDGQARGRKAQAWHIRENGKHEDHKDHEGHKAEMG
jgi:hypothetical protein